MARKKKESTKQIIRGISDGLTNNQISKKYKIPIQTIRGILNKYKLHTNKYEIIKVDKNLEQFILGSLLGDGCISKISGLNKNARLNFGHSLKQKDYIKWKYNFLDSYNLCTKIQEYTHYSNRYKEGKCTTIQFKSKAHPLFTEYRNLFYPKGKKIVPNIIEKLDLLGLTIWYMDDGYMYRPKDQIRGVKLNRAIFATTSFTKEEIFYLIEILNKKFGLDARRFSNQNEIALTVDSTKKFNKLIEPFILESLKYKIDIIPKNNDYIPNKYQQVIRVDINNFNIKEYNSIKEACEDNNITHTLIWTSYTSKKYKYYNTTNKGNYIWFLKDDYLINGIKYERVKKPKVKPVLQYTLSNEFIREWESFKSIKENLGFHESSIIAVCKGRYKQAYNYKWKYK